MKEIDPLESPAVVLLIHGVNSSGEWHDTTTKECHGLFECVSIKYRYYHGLTGALKVYVWPTALWLIIILTTLALCDRTTFRLAVILGVLIAETLVAVQAEYDWSKEPGKFLVPLSYTLLGFATAFFLVGQSRIAYTISAAAATSIYLDLREYGHKLVSASVASMVVVIGTVWGANWLLDQHSTAPLWLTVAALVILMIVEPYIRQAFAFRFVRNRIKEVRAKHAFPHVVAHSLGTYVIGHILNEEGRPFLGRVIFTGCVLDRSFPWHKNVGPETGQQCWAGKI